MDTDRTDQAGEQAMSKDANNNKMNMEKALDRISSRGDMPRYVFVLLIIFYLLTSVLLSRVARSQEMLSIFGYSARVSSFAGVFSSLANISIILLVVYYRKPGFIAALLLLLSQFPVWVQGIMIRHDLSTFSGLFSSLFTIVAMILLYTNNMREEKYQARLRDQAVTDILTGLPNRFACSEVLGDFVRRGEKFTLVSVDLNNFKNINDTMGHETGNGVLIEIASRWKAAADSGASGTSDFVARLAGDEFAILIHGYASDRDVLKTVRYYLSELERKITIDDCDYYITASFGYAEFPTDGSSTDAVVSCADAAMYEVKRTNSSNHIQKCTPDLIKKDHIIETELRIRNALENDLIFFNLQPQYDLEHELRGFEALARMRDTDGSIISPGEFIPVAEKVGLIDKVDATVFRKSVGFFGELIRRSGRSDITLSVNVSVRHLMKNDFLTELRDILKGSGVPAGQLEIEITESIMIDSIEKALECIAEIKKMGIKIAIDDFGTGYSSLSYLNSFPADLLKVDKSFIDRMNTGDSSKKYVAAIISIGHIMNFDVISEGVEEPEQLDTLREIGCDYIQGFIWGRPMMPEQAEELVMNSGRRSSE